MKQKSSISKLCEVEVLTLSYATHKQKDTGIKFYSALIILGTWKMRTVFLYNSMTCYEISINTSSKLLIIFFYSS